MKQILQNLKTGDTEVIDVPCPSVMDGQLLIRTTRSLISAGTERMLVDFGKANLIQKALQQPDKVRMVLDKIKTDGLLSAIEAVRGKLEQSIPLGYCNVGEVLEVGAGVEGYSIGDRIASNGRHAEVVSVPVNLCARIPNNVSDEAAAFVVIGAIALQGIRLAQPTLGESIVVTGLGLIGQMTVQLLRANGCRVLAIDFDAKRLAIAKSFGAEVVNIGAGEDPIEMAKQFSRGRGVDGVLITAATQSSDPMHQAAMMCRKRGRIVLVGVTGLNLSRDDFFKKELTFQVSASYGPGRYDPNYEEKGHDYPIGFVRWTEQRNFEAVLDMLAGGQLDVESLISHQFSLEQIQEAYAIVGGSESSMGILLDYPSKKERTDLIIRKQSVQLNSKLASEAQKLVPNLAFIGAGNYATAVLMPAFKKAGAHLSIAASNIGITGVLAGKKYGFDEAATDTSRLFNDQNINALIITTRHNSHASLVLQALNAGKHIFVEKPLCLTLEELRLIEKEYENFETQADQTPILMVGFNRRFSPQVQKIKSLLLEAVGPKSFVMTVNAGSIPNDHWTQDVEVGGGRIIGEACHFIDLLRFLSGSPIKSWQHIRMDSATNDTVSIQLQFMDGSIGTIHYFANGSKIFPKERLEVFASGRVLQLDNFRKLTGYGWPGFKNLNLWRQDKGQRSCAKAFINAITQKSSSPIPAEELFEVARVSIEILSLKNAPTA